MGRKSQYDGIRGRLSLTIKGGHRVYICPMPEVGELSETIEIDEKETAVFRTKDAEDDTSAADTQTETSETESKETESPRQKSLRRKNLKQRRLRAKRLKSPRLKRRITEK